MKRGEQAKLIRELKEEHNLNPSKTIISRMIKEKDYRIVLTPGGNIKIPETIKALLDSGFGERSEKVNATIGAKKADPQLGAKKESKKPTTSANKETEETAEDESQPLSMASTRARIEKHRAFQSAEKDRIANEVKLGKLIDLDDVSEKSFDLWRQVRESIQSIHDRCAIKIRATESDHEAEQILKEEETRILNSIVEGFSSLNDSDLKKKLLLRLTR